MQYPVIDLKATGDNIRNLLKSRCLTVKQLQTMFGFDEPQAIYKWMRGQNLPAIQNMVILSKVLGVAIEEILVIRDNGD